MKGRGREKARGEEKTEKEEQKREVASHAHRAVLSSKVCSLSRLPRWLSSRPRAARRGNERGK